MHRALLQRAVHTEINSEHSFWDRDPPLPRAKNCKRPRQALQISSLKCLCIFRDISSFFPSFASILMESLLHLSYSNPVNAMQIPSPTFCMLPPCLALCHGPFIPLSDIPKSHTCCAFSLQNMHPTNCQGRASQSSELFFFLCHQKYTLMYLRFF